MRHTQAQLAQPVAIGLDELDDLGLLLSIQAFLPEHTVAQHLLDTDNIVLLGPDVKIQVVASAKQSLQVRSQLRALLDLLLEVDVRDEDHLTLELERTGKRLTVLGLHASLRGPVEPALIGGVQGALEQVEAHVVQKDRVRVVEHDHRARVAVLVERLVEAGGADKALDGRHRNAVAGLGSPNTLLHGVALAQAGRSADHQGLVHAQGSSSGHLLQSVKPALQAMTDLVLGLLPVLLLGLIAADGAERVGITQDDPKLLLGQVGVAGAKHRDLGALRGGVRALDQDRRLLDVLLAPVGPGELNVHGGSLSVHAPSVARSGRLST